MTDSINDRFFSKLEKTQLSLKELFHDDFILKTTPYKNLTEFLSASGFRLQTAADLAAISNDQWNQFIQKCSTFQSFDEMKEAALHEWLIRNI